jgi:hypothetical protein
MDMRIPNDLWRLIEPLRCHLIQSLGYRVINCFLCGFYRVFETEFFRNCNVTFIMLSKGSKY